MRLRTDDQLVALFRMGNEDAFRVIYDRYRQRMFAYTRQMLAGSRSDAEDALQDVFLRAYSALRADGRPVTLRAWLYRVAHNRCIDQLRRPIPAPTDLFDVSRTPLHDPMLETERRDDLRRLVADVRRLPEQQRSALLMREMEGLSYAELADALNVSIPAVKSLLVRARIGLVEAVEARDTACPEIRTDLASAHDRGVRVSGMARRHLRDCDGCREYRSQLRGVQHGLGALSPSPSPLAALAKLLGIGAGGSGAAAGGGAVVGGGAAAATATKVAAIACCAAMVGGGAAQVRQHMAPAGPAKAQSKRASSAPSGGAPTTAPSPDRVLDPGAVAHAAAASGAKAAAPKGAPTTAAAVVGVDNFVDDQRGEPVPSSAPTPTATHETDPAATGGFVAPDEDAGDEGTSTPASDAGEDDSTTDATATVLSGSTSPAGGTDGSGSSASGSGESSTTTTSSTASSSDRPGFSASTSAGAKPGGTHEASSAGTATHPR